MCTMLVSTQSGVHSTEASSRKLPILEVLKFATKKAAGGGGRLSDEGSLIWRRRKSKENREKKRAFPRNGKGCQGSGLRFHHSEIQEIRQSSNVRLRG